MKNIKNFPQLNGHSLPLNFTRRFARRSDHALTRIHQVDNAESYAHLIEKYCAPELANITSILRHPRSLARPLPSWRPPQIKLPAPPAQENNPQGLVLVVTRHRVGPRAKARLRGFGEQRNPAYLVTLRFTDPQGAEVDPQLAEAWVRVLTRDACKGSIHEISNQPTPTYRWLVDGHYVPLSAPASLFAETTKAA